MANQAQIDPTGGPVQWSIAISHLKMGIYRAVVADSSQTVVQKWEDESTWDSLPDSFTITLPASQLVGGFLWFQAIVTDPTDAGGPYVGTVTITQDGNTLCMESAPGMVPSGNGKMDLYADVIRFK